MAPACLFLACKVEEQPRKVDHIIKAVYRILCRDKQPLEPNSEVMHHYLIALLLSSTWIALFSLPSNFLCNVV